MGGLEMICDFGPTAQSAAAREERGGFRPLLLTGSLLRGRADSRNEAAWMESTGHNRPWIYCMRLFAQRVIKHIYYHLYIYIYIYIKV